MHLTENREVVLVEEGRDVHASLREIRGPQRGLQGLHTLLGFIGDPPQGVPPIPLILFLTLLLEVDHRSRLGSWLVGGPVLSALAFKDLLGDVDLDEPLVRAPVVWVDGRVGLQDLPVRLVDLTRRRASPRREAEKGLRVLHRHSEEKTCVE